MALNIKHRFISNKPQSSDTSLVSTNEWNDTHSIQITGPGILGRLSTGTGDVEEIPVGTAKLLLQVPTKLTDFNILDGTAGQVLTTNGSGNFSFTTVTGGTGGTGDWADITNKPTTLVGYGITDAFDGEYSSLNNTPAIPTKLTDLGIVDGATSQVLRTNGSGGFSFSYVEVATCHIAATPPNAPAIGDLWWNSTTGILNIYYSNYGNPTWVTASPEGSDVLTHLSFDGSILTYEDEEGEVTEIDLSVLGGGGSATNTYLTSGTLTGTTLTLTLSDATVVTVDLSALTADQFDGSYTSLTDKPTIPTALTDLGITDGTSGQFLTTDGAGTFSFATVAGGTASIDFVTTGSDIAATLDTFILSKTDSGWNGGKPTGASGACGVMSLQTYVGNYFSQLWLSTATNDLFMRSANNSTTWGAYAKVLTDKNFENTTLGKIARLTVSTAAPTTPAVGMIVVADGVVWDPASKATGISYPAYYNGTEWKSMTP